MAHQTPKEKAEHLVDRYRQEVLKRKYRIGGFVVMDLSKECASIAVDDIINSTPLNPTDVDWDDCGGTHQYWYQAQKKEALEFWKEVKQEIEKL